MLNLSSAASLPGNRHETRGTITIPGRPQRVVMTFGAVMFSLLAQGLTIKLLLHDGLLSEEVYQQINEKLDEEMAQLHEPQSNSAVQETH